MCLGATGSNSPRLFRCRWFNSGHRDLPIRAGGLERCRDRRRQLPPGSNMAVRRRIRRSCFGQGASGSNPSAGDQICRHRTAASRVGVGWISEVGADWAPLALGPERRNPERVHERATYDTDRQIAVAIAVAGGSTVAKLGLRFDRVAVWVLDHLRHFLEATQPEGGTVVLTLTAPIHAPGKTAVALEHELAELLQNRKLGSGRRAILYGNRAELRLVEHAPRQGHRLLGFVHNPDVDAAQVMELVERWLRSTA